MRLWFAGPRLLGGMIRPGVSFRVGDLRFGGLTPPPLAPGAFVYVIEREDNGHQKIGSSENPSARRRTLQTGSSTRLHIVHTTFAGPRAEEVEREAHAFLGARRLEGEWFDVSPETAIAAVYAAAGRLGVALDDDAVPVAGPSFWRIVAGLTAVGAGVVAAVSALSAIIGYFRS